MRITKKSLLTKDMEDAFHSLLATSAILASPHALPQSPPQPTVTDQHHTIVCEMIKKGGERQSSPPFHGMGLITLLGLTTATCGSSSMYEKCLLLIELLVSNSVQRPLAAYPKLIWGHQKAWLVVAPPRTVFEPPPQ